MAAQGRPFTGLYDAGSSPSRGIDSAEESAVRLSGFGIEEDRHGSRLTEAVEDPSFPQFLNEALGWPLVDLAVVAADLGVPDLLGLPAADGAMTAATPYVRDMVMWMTSNGCNAIDQETEADAELFAFVPKVNELRDLCAPYRSFDIPKALKSLRHAT